MEFFLVDVKAIIPASPPQQSELENSERLSDSILECGGLLQPLILEQTGVESCTVISGHAGYYAALKARQKDPRQCEMVNAFVVSSNNEAAVARQLRVFPPSRCDSFPNR